MLTEQVTALRILMNEDLYLTAHDMLLKEKTVMQTLTEEAEISTNDVSASEFIFIGKNLKNFLILTNELLQENHLKALENTLLLKQMSLEDVAIVDFSAYSNTTFKQLDASFMPQKIVCFGLKPEALGLPETQLNQVSTYANCKILYTYRFNEMLGNKEKTKAFWEPMKVL